MNFGILGRNAQQIAGIGPCLYTLAQLSHSNYTRCHGNASKSIEISLFAILGLCFTIQHHFNYRPTRRTTSYCEIIMKYHPAILYAKYNFVRSVGWHLKIKKMCSEMVKNGPKCAKCAISMVLLGVAMATLVR